MLKKDCEELVEVAQTRNMTVKFMIDKMAEAGCPVGPDFFRVETCDKEVGGGFRPPDGVSLPAVISRFPRQCLQAKESQAQPRAQRGSRHSETACGHGLR